MSAGGNDVSPREPPFLAQWLRFPCLASRRAKPASGRDRGRSLDVLKDDA
jgi:hypothetical protein